MVPMRARDDTMTTTEANVLVQYSPWIDDTYVEAMLCINVETSQTNRNKSRLILPQTMEYWKGLNSVGSTGCLRAAVDNMTSMKEAAR